MSPGSKPDLESQIRQIRSQALQNYRTFKENVLRESDIAREISRCQQASKDLVNRFENEFRANMARTTKRFHSKQTTKPKTSRTWAPYLRLERQGVPIPQEACSGNSPAGGPLGDVYLHSGEWVHGHTDLFIEGRAGLNLEFERYYRSCIDYSGPLGIGWDHSYNQRLQRVSTREMKFFTGQKSVCFIKKNKRWKPSPGEYLDLEQFEKGWHIHTPELRTLIFEPCKTESDAWRLVRIEDLHREDDGALNVLTLDYYEESDVLIRITDPEGRELEFGYHTSGNQDGLISFIRYLDWEVQFNYDVIGAFPLLRSVKTIGSPRTGWDLAEDVPESTWEYSYDQIVQNRSRHYRLLSEISTPEGKPLCRTRYETSPSDPFVFAVRTQTQDSSEDEIFWEWRFCHEMDYTSNRLSAHYSVPELHASKGEIIQGQLLDYLTPTSKDGVDSETAEENVGFKTSTESPKEQRLRCVIAVVSSSLENRNEQWGQDDLELLNSLMETDLFQKAASDGKSPQPDVAPLQIAEVVVNLSLMPNNYQAAEVVGSAFKYADGNPEHLPDSPSDDLVGLLHVWKLRASHRYDFPFNGPKGLALVPDMHVRPCTNTATKYKSNSQGEFTQIVKPRGNKIDTVFDESNKDYRFRGNILEKRVFDSALSSEPAFRSAFTYNETLGRMTSRVDFVDEVLAYQESRKWNSAGDLVELMKGTSDSPDDQVSIRYSYNRFGQLTEVRDSGGYCESRSYHALDSTIAAKLEEGGRLATVKLFAPTSIQEPHNDSDADSWFEEYVYDEYGRVVRCTTNGRSLVRVYSTVGHKLLEVDPTGVPMLFRYSPTGQLLEQRELITSYQHLTEDVLRGIAGLEAPVPDGVVRRTEYSYNIAGIRTDRHVHSVIGDESRHTRWSRFSDGNLRTKTLPSGIRRMEHRDNLTGLQYQETIEGPIDAESPVEPTVLSFVLTRDENGQPIEVSKGRSEVVRLKHDVLDRIVEEIRADGTRKSIKLDWKGDPLSKTIHELSSMVEDKLDKQHALFAETWSYNMAGRLIERSLSQSPHGEGTSGARLLTRFRCDGGGRCIETIMFSKNRRLFTRYDALGEWFVEWDEAGYGTLHLNDAGRRIGTFELLGIDKQTGELLARGEIWVDDDNGRRLAGTTCDRKLVPIEQRTVLTEYDTAGRLLLIREPSGRETAAEYNSWDLKTLETRKGEGGLGYRSGDIACDEFTYDHDGRLLTISSNHITPVKSETNTVLSEIKRNRTIRYDTLGRERKTEQYDCRWAEKTYDSDSRVTLVKLGKGNKTLEHLGIEYDSCGRPYRLSTVDGDQSKVLQEVEYDSLDRITLARQRQEHTDEAQWPHWIQTRRSYDGLGSITKESTELIHREDYENQERCVSYLHDYKRDYKTVCLPVSDKSGTSFWSKTSYGFDGAGHLSTVSIDGDTIAQLVHQGSLPLTREVNHGDSTVRETRAYNHDFLLESIRFDTPKKQTDDSLIVSYQRVPETGKTRSMQLRFNWTGSESLSRSKVFDYSPEGRLVFSSRTDLEVADINDFADRIVDPANAWRFERILGDYFSFDTAGHLCALSKGRNILEDLEPSEVIKLHQCGDSVAEKTALVFIPEEGGLSDCLQEIQSFSGSSNSFSFDHLGRLKGAKTIEASLEGSQQLAWKYEFDPLNNLLKADATTAGGSSGSSRGNHQHARTVQFGYDFFGRRVLKKSVDYIGSTPNTDLVWFIYDHGEVVLELRYHDAEGWRPYAEYLPGAGPREVILAALPAHSVKATPHEVERFFFWQDPAASVLFATFLDKDGSISSLELEDHVRFGDPHNKAPIQAFLTNLRTDENFPESGWQSAVDGDICSSWKLVAGTEDDPGVIEIDLKRPTDIERLKIFAPRFWGRFEVISVGAKVISELAKEQEAQTEESNSLSEDSNLLSGETRRILEDQTILSKCRTETFSPKNQLIDPNLPCDWHTIPINLRSCTKIILVGKTRSRVEIAQIELLASPGETHPFGFGGSRYDRETGLYYHGARYRLPDMHGRFMSPEPFGFLLGPALYAYAEGDPINKYDPDGRFVLLTALAIGAAIGAVVGGGGVAVSDLRSGRGFSLKRTLVGAGVGSVAGGLAGVTFGAVSGAIATAGGVSIFGATIPAAISAPILGGSAAGAVGGAAAKGLSTGIVTYSATGDLSKALSAGTKAAGKGAIIGAIAGGAAGAVASVAGFGLSGMTAAGGTAGSIDRGIEGTLAALDEGFGAALMAGMKGAMTGAVVGAVTGAAVFGAANVTGLIKPFDHPNELPKPHGALIKTNAQNRGYGGFATEPGTARHHVKPLSLGGSNSASNIQRVSIEIHQANPHGVPGGDPGIYYYLR